MQILEPDTVIAAQVAAHVYRPDVAIRRDALRTAESIFERDAPQAILAHGPIGSGKTTWACQIAVERVRHGNGVAFLSVADVDREDHNGARDIVNDLLQRAENSKDGHIVVLIDDA